MIQKFFLFFIVSILILTSCRSRDCHIKRISATDKQWMIPMESFAAIGFASDKNGWETLRSSYGTRDFSDCDGWFGNGNKYEIIEKEFDKDSCNTPRCHMKMTISRNAANRYARIHFELFDFKFEISRDQDKKVADGEIYVPGLKQDVAIWNFKNTKADAEIKSVSYSKTFGIVGYEKRNGETFVMDSVFARPYSPL